MFEAQLDNYAYDYMFRLYPAPAVAAAVVLLAIDERTLSSVRAASTPSASLWAAALRLIAPATPKAVAVDVILAERSQEPGRGYGARPGFPGRRRTWCSSCELIDDGRQWEDPLEEFRRGAALGHGLRRSGQERHRHACHSPGETLRPPAAVALSLEAFRLSRRRVHYRISHRSSSRHAPCIPVRGDGRSMRVRFIPSNMLPNPQRIHEGTCSTIPPWRRNSPAQVVFVGVTAITEVRDRLLTPNAFSRQTSGSRSNAQAFENHGAGPLSSRMFPTSGCCSSASAWRWRRAWPFPVPAGVAGIRRQRADSGGRRGGALRLFHPSERPFFFDAGIPGGASEP